MDGRVSTAAEWVTLTREASRRTLGEAPTEDDLCYLEDGNHTVEIDGETDSFVCVLDPLVVPFLRDSPGTVRSVTPEDGASVTVDIDGDGTTASSGSAVVSLGVSRDPDVDAPPTREDISDSPYD